MRWSQTEYILKGIFLGLLLAAEGRTAEAEAQLSAALRLNPGFGQARRTLEDLRRRHR